MHSACMGAIVLASLAATSLSAQSTVEPPKPGHLEFHVTDQTGAWIANADVRVKTSEFTTRSKTDERGDATIEVPPGKYNLFVTSIGFEEWNQEVNIAPGFHISSSIVLKVSDTQCDPCEDFSSRFPSVEVDRILPDVQIPLLPLKSLEIAGVKVRRKRLFVSQ